MSDDPIQPVSPVDLDAVTPIQPIAPRSVEQTRVIARASDQALATNVERAELEHPVQSPSSVNMRATVHDAAQHGNPIAAAIEASERAQQLAGAQASAASGQSTPADPAAAEEPAERDAHDPLAPVTRIDEDPHRRDPRSQEERDRDADLRP
jgi:hypothetical protein